MMMAVKETIESVRRIDIQPDAGTDGVLIATAKSNAVVPTSGRRQAGWSWLCLQSVHRPALQSNA